MYDILLTTADGVLLVMTEFPTYLRRRIGRQYFELVLVEPEPDKPAFFVSPAAIEALSARDLIERIDLVRTEGAFYVLSDEGLEFGRSLDMARRA